LGKPGPAPGGSYDLVGRHLTDMLSKRAGQAFFVEDKPGAGTVVGMQAAAQSEPDGYTSMVGGLSNMALTHSRGRHQAGLKSRQTPQARLLDAFDQFHCP
jgi:tripartite-type tricarboxylate transporter receptor subunit TctC